MYNKLKVNAKSTTIHNKSNKWSLSFSEQISSAWDCQTSPT